MTTTSIIANNIKVISVDVPIPSFAFSHSNDFGRGACCLFRFFELIGHCKSHHIDKMIGTEFDFYPFTLNGQEVLPLVVDGAVFGRRCGGRGW